MKSSILLSTISVFAAVVATTAIAPVAQADDAPELSYSFIEGGYLTTRNGLRGSTQDGNTTVNFVSSDTDGFFGRLSYQFSENMYVWGDFSQNKYELAASAVDGATTTEAFYSLKPRRYMGGLGLIHKLDDNFHLFAEGGLTVNHFKTTIVGANTNPNGVLLSVVDAVTEDTRTHGFAKAGLRYMTEFGLEMNLAASWAGDSRITANDTGDDLRIADEFAGEAGLRYHFNNNFSLGASYRRTSENTFLGSVRFSF